MISKASISDLREISEVCGNHFPKSGIPGLFIPEAFTAVWGALVASGIGIVWVLRVGGRAVGALGAIGGPDPNDGFRVASCLFWYVLPQYRGGGMKLFREFETWARATYATRMNMSHLLTEDSERLEAFFCREGFEPVEVHYRKRLIYG